MRLIKKILAWLFRRKKKPPVDRLAKWRRDRVAPRATKDEEKWAREIEEDAFANGELTL